ncbi:MAG: polyprenyl synthetase family protein [Ignavibacteriales bacterium]|nr:polyprenyl synthetase family protein [Ignavibacteriales bacterium]
MKEFNGRFKLALKSKVGLLDLIVGYIVRQKGKKIRPLLVILSAKAVNQVEDRTYRGAILVEMLHTATLVHDDVVDNAEKRRGFPSINAIWKNKISVLMGDYLLARGLMLSVESGDYDFLNVITDTVKRMSEGELLQISKTRKLNNDEATYYRIISDKTASLIETCCKIGALSSTQNPEYLEALRNYGENVGMAFQIRDDILDYTGKSSIIGKPEAGDLKEKKLTLPLIHALSIAPKKDSDAVRKKIRQGITDKSVNEVIQFIKYYGGIEYSQKIAEEFISKAESALTVLPDSEAREKLFLLANYVIQREK